MDDSKIISSYGSYTKKISSYGSYTKKIFLDMELYVTIFHLGNGSNDHPTYNFGYKIDGILYVKRNSNVPLHTILVTKLIIYYM